MPLTSDHASLLACQPASLPACCQSSVRPYLNPDCPPPTAAPLLNQHTPPTTLFTLLFALSLHVSTLILVKLQVAAAYWSSLSQPLPLLQPAPHCLLVQSAMQLSVCLSSTSPLSRTLLVCMCLPLCEYECERDRKLPCPNLHHRIFIATVLLPLTHFTWFLALSAYLRGIHFSVYMTILLASCCSSCYLYFFIIFSTLFH